MEPLQGGTIPCSTHDATLTEIDSDIGHDRSVKNSDGSSTRESKFTAHRPTMPWLQGCWLIKSPPSPKDNEEVNTHVKRLQALLDAATVADTIYDQEDGDQGHDDDHRESLHGDSASSITPWEEHGRGCNRDNHDLRDVICARDARGRIKSRRQN
jgi:hypothetical protein